MPGIIINLRSLFLPLQPLLNADAFLHNTVCMSVCVGAKPKRYSGHFLPDRSQREQLSMRVSHMTDSPLCGGQPGHFQSGDIHFGKRSVPPTSPVQCVSSILPRIKSHQRQCHFPHEPIPGTARGAAPRLSWKQISSTTQQSLPMGKPRNGLSVFKHPHSFLYFSLLLSTCPVLWSKL